MPCAGMRQKPHVNEGTEVLVLGALHPIHAAGCLLGVLSCLICIRTLAVNSQSACQSCSLHAHYCGCSTHEAIPMLQALSQDSALSTCCRIIQVLSHAGRCRSTTYAVRSTFGPLPTYLDHLNVCDGKLIGLWVQHGGHDCIQAVAVNNCACTTQLIRLQCRTHADMHTDHMHATCTPLPIPACVIHRPTRVIR